VFMTKTVEDWIPTRQSLLSRLRDWDDKESWEDFFNTYWKLIYNVARQSGLNDAEAQEVVQETVINVAKKISQFRYDPAKGSFQGWLVTTRLWGINDQCRKRRGQVALDADDKSDTASEERLNEPALSFGFESQWDELWQENLMGGAM